MDVTPDVAARRDLTDAQKIRLQRARNEARSQRDALDAKYRQNVDGSSVHDGGLYACSECDRPIAYYTWETNSGICEDCVT